MQWLKVTLGSRSLLFSQSWTAHCTSSLSGTLRLVSSSSAACKDDPLPNSSPSSGELYGREDRDPSPSPNAAVTQASLDEMAFPRDDKEVKTDGIKPEGNPNPKAYPVQNDPSIPEGAGPDVEKIDPAAADKLSHQAEAEQSGPKAAGQGVVEDLAKKDPERHGSDRGGPM
ncbi:hypothetical protein OEZ86_009822 [Tetradesmus obliquus]|uniref:Uncharacterized protein n=1 Tax=Tetradesmus obliquus TaxID=3088 RepID=A0ABY8UPJ6_TETOB|nr:hypothetical protein OEZ85_001262 [Tetradesmus obliquus]WIA43324.1 hypothetical protein OEZ86_009822 [Tetradesmus obliquus]